MPNLSSLALFTVLYTLTLIPINVLHADEFQFIPDLANPLKSLSKSKPDPSDPAGQFRLGKMYDTGVGGVAKDKQLAILWYRKAADQGYPEAQLLLGIIYDQGIGVAKDYAKALVWYRKAAEQGYAKAQFNLAGMYDEGLGVEQDYRQAAAWYLKAAEQGYPRAQFNLGSMYFNGEGVPQDNILGYMWLKLAADEGLEKEVEQRLALIIDLSPGQIKKAKKKAREWKALHKQGHNNS